MDTKNTSYKQKVLFIDRDGTIIAEPPVNFDAPATWSAWDTVPFMLRKPWTGTADATCN